MAKNFFKKFDEETLLKLEIFEDYFKEWLPVFIKNAINYSWTECFIYDFFAGAGKDTEDRFGSPLIILKTINENIEKIIKSKLKIRFTINEFDEVTFARLKENVRIFLENNHAVKDSIEIEFCKEDFKKLFNEIKFEYDKPNFMFLDQFGVKQITEEVFKKLISFKRNDFLFFISSTHIKRFGDSLEFQKYLKIKKENFENAKPFHAHRIVFEYYKSLINNNYVIAPFSIKKNQNIHGLIFGSNHSYGVEKFLKVCWNINKNTGDANYNIDDEKIIDGQLSIFPEENKIKKLSHLEEKIENWIKRDLSLYEIYNKTIEFGCQPKHANNFLKGLIKNRKIKPLELVNDRIHQIDKNKKIEFL